MAKIYYNLIISGRRIIDNVPLKWRKEVEKMLEGDADEDNRNVSDTK